MRSSLLLNALAAVGVIAILLSGRGEARAFELAAASGALSLSNSLEGAAILHGENLRPGARTSGTVTLTNPGATTTALALEVSADEETAGSGGGRLWDRLQIAVSNGATTLYSGPLAGLGRLPVGELAAGAGRTYTFDAWLPAGTDNAYQGARLSVRFTWLAQPGSATPSPVPPPPAPPAPTPAPVSDPNATVAAERIVALPAARSCLTRTLRVRAPQGVRVKAVSVKVNGRRAGSAKSGRADIRLKALRRGKARVQVAITLASGRTLTLKRTYRRVC